jgi:Cyclophilin-like family
MSSLILLFSLLVPGAGAISAQPEELRMWMTVGERRFAVTLTDNAAARAFAAQLPLTLDMSELNGNEKHADLPKSLPANANRPGTIRNGDLMVWRGHPGGLLPDVSIVVLVHPPWSGGRPFRPATGAGAARCSSPILQGLVF